MLLKDGTQYGQEPYNKVVATALHKRLLDSGDFVSYTLEGEGATALSCCANFLTDEEEYVPALYVERHLEQGRATGYEHYLSCCASLGVSDAQRALDRMIVCDDIIATPQLAAGERSFSSKQFYESPAKQLLLVKDVSFGSELQDETYL